MSIIREICEAIRSNNENRFCTLVERSDIRDYMGRKVWPDINESPMHVAITSGRSEYLPALFQRGAAINSIAHSYQQNPDYAETPLHTAVFKKDAEAAKFLLKFGADAALPGSRVGLAGSSKRWAEELKCNEILSMMEKFEMSGRRTKYQLVFMFVLFVVAPVTSFLFFTILNSMK